MWFVGKNLFHSLIKHVYDRNKFIPFLISIYKQVYYCNVNGKTIYCHEIIHTAYMKYRRNKCFTLIIYIVGLHRKNKFVISHSLIGLHWIL